MKIIKTANYEEMSRQAAQVVLEKLKEKSDLVLGLATGSTPTGLYKELIRDHQDNGTSYVDVRTVNLDEYIGLPTNDPNSYHTFMETKLFHHLDVKREHTFLPDGEAADLEKESIRYEELIRTLQVDVQVLGIGENGHIGFNEPGTPFDQKTHVTKLAPSTREANARFFQTIEEVPERAITMGIDSIINSREIVLLASGKRKADAVQKLLEGMITEQFPASVLHQHCHVTLIADEDALSLVP